MEDELFRQVFLAPPDDPPNAGVHQTILVAAHVDALDERQPEVPLQLRVEERRNEPAARRIDVDRSVPTALQRIKI